MNSEKYDLKRSSRLKLNSTILLICQFSNMGISFFIVPLTMSYLGVEDYGVWITFITIIEWFNLFDIGLGHGLRNKYTEAKANGLVEEIIRYVSSAFYVLVFISLILVFVFLILAFIVDWTVVLNARKEMYIELRYLVLFVGFFFCARFVLNIISVLLTADQQPFISAVILLSGNVLSVLGIYLLINNTAPSILWLGMVTTISQLIPLMIAFIYFFSNRYVKIRPRISSFSKKHVGAIFNLGGRFFCIQITALLLFATNNMILAHTCGNSSVSEFSIAYKYMNIIYLIFMSLLTPLWSACTDAYAKKDYIWIKNIFARFKRVWMGMMGIGLVLMLMSPLVYKVWLKNEIIPDYILLLLLYIYMWLWTWYTLYRTFMNGTGKIRLQFYITSIEAILHIPIAIFLSKWLGIYGLVITMIIWAGINSIWEPIQYKRILHNTAYGIWNK